MAAVLETAEIEVPRKDGQPGRTAVVEIRVQKVRLAVPSSGPQQGRCGPLEVTAVRVSEVNAPEGVEPVHWLLLSLLAA